MAAIVFVDIVSYSRMPNEEQQELSQEINERCSRFLIPEFRHQRLARVSNQSLMVAAMPTGDGIVICLDRTPRQNLDTGHVLLLLSFYLSEWARLRGIALRIGLHSGDLAVIEDINGNSNFCGHAINQTQRIMDLGGPEGHILCSTDFNQSYLNSKKVRAKLAEHVRGYTASRGLLAVLPKDNPASKAMHAISDSATYEIQSIPLDGDYTVKHGYQLRICNVVLSGDIAIPGANGQASKVTVTLAGCSDPPPFRVVHEILDPKRMEDNVGLMLENTLFSDCERIVVIGSINERFGNHFDAARGKGQFSGLTRVEVYFCTEAILASMRKLQDIDYAHTSIGDIPDKINNRNMVRLRADSMSKLRELASGNQTVDFRFFEYPFLPCAGVIAGYRKIDSADPVIIQVNRYVWGQKSLWSSVQVLRRSQHSNDLDEYSKFKRYIDFTKHNSTPIATPKAAVQADDKDRAEPGPAPNDGRKVGRRR